MSPDASQLGASRYLIAPDLMLVAGDLVSGHGAVVDTGRFIAVGPLPGLQRDHPSLTPVRATGQLLMPGFIDAHHHLSQSFGTAYAFGEPSEIFRRVWVPLESALTEEELHASAALAALESLRGGFTTVADAGGRSRHDLGLVADATQELGLRCVLSIACTEDDEATSGPADHLLARASDHLADMEKRPLTYGSIAVPVPEAVTPQTLQALVELCRASDAPLQIHVNEHLVGVERMLVATGRRPLERLDDLGAVGRWLLASHTTLLTPAEMLILRDRGAAVSYNPVASAWKGNVVAPALALASLGVRMGLGTDGTRSDGFRLLDAAELAQRLTFAMPVGDPVAGAGRLWLEAATTGGADAVGLGETVGRIAAGMAADFLLVDLDVPELVSSRDLRWELVRRGSRDLIRMVVVDGRPRLVDGWPPDLDRQEFLARTRRLAAAAVRRAGLRVSRP